MYVYLWKQEIFVEAGAVGLFLGILNFKVHQRAKVVYIVTHP